MKRSFKAVLLAAGISLISVSTWLLFNPVTALAASCTATCRTGSMPCEGDQCRAVDYDGCYYTINGVEKRKRCDVARDRDESGGGGYEPIIP